MQTPHTESSEVQHNWISRVRVEGGYIDGLDIEFSSGGNVIIGEPGTGKSTLLALIRYVLALPVPAPKRKEFEDLVAKNLRRRPRLHHTLHALPR